MSAYSVAERTQTAMQELEGCFAFIDTVDEALRFAHDVKANTLSSAMQLSGCTRDSRLLIAFKETANHTHSFILKAAITMEALAAFIRATHCSVYHTGTTQLNASVDRANDAYAAFQTELADLLPHSEHAAGAVQAFDKLLQRRLSGPPLVRAVSKRAASLCKRVLPSRRRHRTKLAKLRDTLDEMQWSVFATGKLMSHLQHQVPDLLNREAGFVGYLAYKLDACDWVYLVELMDLLQEKYLDVKDAADYFKDMAAEMEQVA
ncbi:uncharacterized protein SCHCODRAFT_02690097 [Schizophyllum commune H4-8]|uniref:uncharacterized protein n=1 Tax=Schizophyllum commune (strain H4-8 / FGSC 9210) TaxID=578458 RepID=UPI002160353A|nr:uncharacterized protein SCHCODRAFT_02690097 [Schizophyllum commune H4-8]KAI5890084.1 hypothetical protein SCHCODRAFT_02690097 [Schizophyllum commune H4-8]